MDELEQIAAASRDANRAGPLRTRAGMSGAAIGLVAFLGTAGAIALAIMFVMLPRSSPAVRVAPILVDATDLVAEYKGNEVRADAIYREKILDVRGRIHSIRRDLGDQAFVTLDGGDPVRTVQCIFSREKEADLVNLERGKSCRIQGRCHGLMINVIVRECRIVEQE